MFKELNLHVVVFKNFNYVFTWNLVLYVYRWSVPFTLNIKVQSGVKSLFFKEFRRWKTPLGGEHQWAHGFYLNFKQTKSDAIVQLQHTQITSLDDLHLSLMQVQMHFLFTSRSYYLEYFYILLSLSWYYVSYSTSMAQMQAQRAQQQEQEVEDETFGPLPLSRLEVTTSIWECMYV